ncbi:MAG: DNA polymerase III subunit beta [Elusimicrobia bacterium]|jgi:DNA polymerase-3 subunit beta|nr:DNA polymerase III subunit beta [Elusimicrobiota bacterium]
MKIHCNKEDLTKGIQTIQSALSSRTTLPILLNFMMETESSKIKVSSTDLEMGVKHYLPAEVEADGSITIPAKKFSEILHSLPDGHEVELSVDAGDKVHVKCGRSRFALLGAPKSEYPVLPEFDRKEAFSLPMGLVADMVRKTIFAASSDETRHVLNGVYWSARKGALEMVATDGRRLAVTGRKGALKDREFQIIVPTKVLAELLRLFSSRDIKPDAQDKLQVGVTDNQIVFQAGETTLISRLIGGTFPNYEQVIPQKKDISVVLGAADLLAVTKRAALCALDRGGSVKFALLKKCLHISASSPNLEFNDELEVDYSGADFQVAFNPHFMVDALKHADCEKVSLGFTSPVNPVLIEPVGGDESRFVIMPMRI